MGSAMEKNEAGKEDSESRFKQCGKGDPHWEDYILGKAKRSQEQTMQNPRRRYLSQGESHV